MPNGVFERASMERGLFVLAFSDGLTTLEAPRWCSAVYGAVQIHRTCVVASMACDADAPDPATNLQVTGGVVNSYRDVTLKKWHGDALLIIGSLSLLHLLSRY